MLSPKPAMRLAIAIGTADRRDRDDRVRARALEHDLRRRVIYLRYVRNLHAGCGPTFNCGQPPVEGFTSPLYLAVLWAGAAFTGTACG